MQSIAPSLLTRFAILAILLAATSPAATYTFREVGVSNFVVHRVVSILGGTLLAVLI